jgi:dihydropteroate synthase
MLSLEYLSTLYQTYQDTMNLKVEEFSIGNQSFAFNTHPSIMGIINLSHDSWYRESVCLNVDMAENLGKVLKAQGADIIDVGAESSSLQAQTADQKQQIAALLPVLNTLKQQDIITSIETYYPEVVKACLTAGADMINLAGTVDSKAIYPMIAEHDAAVVICYIQGKHARETSSYDFSTDPLDLMYDFFAHEIDVATSMGVKKIVIDSGVGFKYTNLEENPKQQINFQMRTLLNSFRLRKLGYPICNILPAAFLCFGQEVLAAEGFFAVLAALGKTDIVRTHEVPKIKSTFDVMSLFDNSLPSNT